MVSLSLKARDAWWTVIVIDPIAGALVRLVAGARAITPNLLTLVSATVAAAAIASFAVGWLVAGALLFQASFLIDCMDGKLANLRRQFSRYGGFFDVVADTLRFGGCAAAIAYSAAPEGSDAAAWVAVLALYPAVHYGVIVTGAAWPDRGAKETVTVPATPLALLRAAPSRLGRPGSTVDAEAVAFTIGPLIGHPLLGILAAVALNGVHLLTGTALRLRHSVAVGEEPA
jgi:phosphatidylglycerophosphate synthase